MTGVKNFIAKWGGVAALVFGMLPLPDSSSQWQFSLLLLTSMLLMAWWGHIVLHRVLAGATWLSQSFFLKVCFGQFALLFVWVIASPFLFLLQKVLDFPLLLAMVASVAVVVTFFLARDERQSFVYSLGMSDAGRIAFLIFASACISKVAVYYSVRSGALGLDTHQHIFYVTDLYKAGYLKLSAGSTDWIEQYPKGLHAISALWGIPGFGDHLGSFVKVMPALQQALVAFSFVELCAIWLYRSKPSEQLKALWWLIVSVGLAYEFYRGTRFAYPISDLNSTGRIGSAAVLFIPAIAGGLAMLYPTKGSVALASATLPFAGAVAAKFNPTLSVAFLAISVPMWLATAGLVIWQQKTLRRSAGYPFVAATGVGLGLLFFDPFYLPLFASKSPFLTAILENGLGLRLLPHAVIGESVANGLTLSGLIKSLLGNMIFTKSLLASVIPDSTMVISQKLLALTRLSVWVGLVLWMLDRLVISRSGQEDYSKAGNFILVALQVSLLVGTWLNKVLGLTISDVVGATTLQASIISTYSREFSNILVLFALPIHFILAVTMSASGIRRILYASQPWWKWVFAALIVGLGLSARMWSVPGAPRAEDMGWWQPLKESQIDAFQDFEKKIPKDAVVLSEATAVTLNGREDWILPMGESAAYLPFAKRHYLFNARLGDGYDLKPEDLKDIFCNGSVNQIHEFLRQRKVGFIFTVDSPGITRQQVFDKTYCGTKFSALGVVYPAYAKGNGGLAIYELRP